MTKRTKRRNTRRRISKKNNKTRKRKTRRIRRKIGGGIDEDIVSLKNDWPFLSDTQKQERVEIFKAAHGLLGLIQFYKKLFFN
jgi:hypothetical protein